MKVRDIMTRNPATCTPDTDLQKVARMMVQHDCGAIPVVDNSDSGRPVGVITDRDITVRIVAQGQNPLQMRVSDAMTRSTVTVTPDANVKEAEKLMKDNQVRRLVVVDDGGNVVGIVAQADLAREVSDKRVGDVVEEVSEPSGAAS